MNDFSITLTNLPDLKSINYNADLFRVILACHFENLVR